MAIHPKLEPYQDVKYVKKFSKVLDALEKDLESVQCPSFSAEIVTEVDERTFGDKFLQFRSEAHFDRIMLVDANLQGRDVVVSMPMESVYFWPYSVDIPLNVEAQGAAVYEQGFAKKRWVTDPKNEELERDLKGLKLPNIKWQYKDRANKFKVSTAFVIQADEETGRAVWTLHSGYFPASFLGGKLPKVSTFVEAASDLERILASHWH